MSPRTYQDDIYECFKSFWWFNTIVYVVIAVLTLVLSIRHRGMLKFNNYLIMYSIMFILTLRMGLYTAY